MHIYNLSQTSLSQVLKLFITAKIKLLKTFISMFQGAAPLSIYIYMYKPNRCNKSVTDMAWISRVLNTISCRAKTQIKGKFLLSVATLSFTHFGDHQATDRSLFVHTLKHYSVMLSGVLLHVGAWWEVLIYCLRDFSYVPSLLSTFPRGISYILLIQFCTMEFASE